jgi:hypothetical protein
MQSPPDQLEQFRRLMEADPSLQEELCQPDDPALFIALVVERARDRGLGLDATRVEAAIRANRPVCAAATADAGGAAWPPKGWLPVKAQWRDGKLHLDWIYLGPRRLSDPFFEETVVRYQSKPFNRLFRTSTPIDALPGWLRRHPGLAPTGFIFHMSRCGSTLVSQMLAAIPGNIVVSEAGPIDTVVQARHARPDLGHDQQAAWLRWMIDALGQPRDGAERHFFVKLDSWHALALPLFRRAFPTVPWIFLYRDPVEVLVSQLRQRGIHMVHGLTGEAIFGFPASQATQPPETYCAEVLARIGDAVLRQYAPGTALLVNYRQLPAALWRDVLPHFGLPCSDGDRAAMADAARYDAKSPDLPFIHDSAAKQALATDKIRSAARPLDELHTRLEALRLGTASAGTVRTPASPAASVI